MKGEEETIKQSLESSFVHFHRPVLYLVVEAGAVTKGAAAGHGGGWGGGGTLGDNEAARDDGQAEHHARARWCFLWKKSVHVRRGCGCCEDEENPVLVSDTIYCFASLLEVVSSVKSGRGTLPIKSITQKPAQT